MEAQALLKVRLEHVRAILESALRAVAENPQILQSLGRAVDGTAEQQVGGVARQAVGEGGAVRELSGAAVSDATHSGVGEAVGEATEEAQQGAVGQVAGQGGEGAQGASEEAREEEGEVKATPSAERLARELGVDLWLVEGTAVSGRITVRDARSAAQQQ